MDGDAVSECVITYDGVPTCWRAALAEPIPDGGH